MAGDQHLSLLGSGCYRKGTLDQTQCHSFDQKLSQSSWSSRQPRKNSLDDKFRRIPSRVHEWMGNLIRCAQRISAFGPGLVNPDSLAQAIFWKQRKILSKTR